MKRGKEVLNEFENSCKNCKWNADETRHWNKEFETDENADEDEADFLQDKKY